jgi:nucleotide-binding universal stress UspA family protein
LEYAINFANTFKASILLVWVDNVSSDETAMPIELPDSRKVIANNLEALVEKYKDQLKHGEITFKIRRGKVHQEIANQAKYIDAELVIAGTHGVSGFEEFWIGSNAYRIVTYAPCPVITVRTNYEIKEDIKKIALPIDSSLESRQKVPYAAKVAKYFGSEIHIVSLYSSAIKVIKYKVDNYSKQVQKYLDEENVPYKIETVDAENITNATVEYAKAVDADLIVIMTEQETTTANLFLGAYAQQMVNHSPIPVLSIHAKEYVRVLSR